MSCLFPRRLLVAFTMMSFGASCDSTSKGGGAGGAAPTSSPGGGSSTSSSGGTGGGSGGLVSGGGQGGGTAGAGGNGGAGTAGAGGTSSSTSGSGGQGGGACGGLWSKRFGDAGDQSAAQLGVSNAGAVVVGDAFNGTIDLGGGSVTCPAAKYCGFVAAFDPAGTLLWKKQFADGATGEISAFALGVAPGGDIAIGGGFSGSVDFGAGAMSCAAKCAFVGKLDAAGSVLWVKTFATVGNADQAEAAGVAIASSGAIALLGRYTGPVDFGGGALPSNPPSPGGMFLVRLDALGAYVSSRGFPNEPSVVATAGQLFPLHVVLDSIQSAIVAAKVVGAVHVDGVTWSAFGGVMSAGSVVAKFDGSNALVWSKSFHNNIETRVGRPAIGPGDRVAATALSGVDPIWNKDPNVPLGNGIAAGLFDSGGALSWGRYDTGSSIYRMGTAVAVDASSNTFLVGYFDGTFDMGAGTLTATGGPGDRNVFITKIDANNAPLSSVRFGDADAAAYNAAADPSGCALVVGAFAGTIDFGYGTMASAGLHDIFLAKLAP